MPRARSQPRWPGTRHETVFEILRDHLHDLEELAATYADLFEANR